MGSIGLQRWARLVLAACALGHGMAWAASGQVPPSTQHSLELTRPPTAGTTDVEVATAEGLSIGAWLLVQPDGDGPWQLTRVERVEGNRLELNRFLDGLVLSSRPQVSVLRTQEQPTLHAAWQDAAPQAGARGLLAIKGQTHPDDWAVIFVDGVEAARVQADSLGRISEVVPVYLGSDSSQVQWVSSAGSGWEVGTLAAPSQPVVLEPVNDSYTSDTTPLFRGTAEPGVTVLLTISGVQVGSTTADASGNWAVSVDRTLADNVYRTSVTARSASGEVSTVKVVTFVVDTEPPVTNIVRFPSAYQGTSNFRVEFLVSDFGFSECSYDGGSFQRCTSPYELQNMPEGPHSLTVRSTDRANNVEVSPTTVRWTVDITPPDIRLISGAPRWTNRAGATFTFGSTEQPVTFECKFDGGAPFTCESGIEIGFVEGPHTFQVRARDRASLYSDWTPLHEWTADFNPPAPAVLLQPQTGVLLGTGTPTFSGTAEPLGTVTVLANQKEIGTASVDVEGNWTFTPSTGLVTDAYQVRVIARDQAGNASEPSAPLSLRVDVDPPDTSISSGPDGLSQEATPLFTFSATEPGVTYECSIGEEPFGSCVALTQGTRSFEPGRYTLRVRARDEVGNVDDSPATATWVYSTYGSSGGGLSGCSASGAAPLLPLVPLLAFLKRRRSRSSHREVVGRGGLSALLLVFLAGSARAQGVDLQQYKPAPGSKDVLGVYSPQVAPGVGMHAGLSVSYARNPLVLRTAGDGGFAQSIVSDQVTADVLASISFLDHFELGLALPVTGQWGPTAGNLGVFIPENATGTGLGDLRLVPKAVFSLGETLSLGAAAVVSLPTANSQSFLGTGGVGVQPMVLAQWAASQQLRVLANVGGRFQPASQVPLIRLNVGNELAYALGAHWSGANSKLFVQGSLEGAVALSDAQSSAIPLELLAAVGYSLPGGMAVRLGGGPGLTSGYGTPNFRLFAGLSWAPGADGNGQEARLCTGKPDADEDGDGVLNAGDLCPSESGDRGDGCPRDSGAERVQALAQLFKNDSDKDGFLDDEDACPNELGVRERRGCAVPTQPAGKESESIVVTISFPVGKPETDSPKKLDNVVVRLQELLKNNQLAKVHASFAPDQAGATLMQQRAASVSAYLTQRIPELKGADKLKVDFQGKPARRSGGKDVLDIKLTFVRPVAPTQLPPLSELACADQGVAARLMSSHGEVMAGAETTLKALANEGKVCDGDLVKTGPAAGAVLVLSAGNVLRLAPDSQVKLSRNGMQLLQGTVEPEGNQVALAAPEILPPCKGSSPRAATISWQKVPGAKRYWVQVARGADFNSDVHFVLTERTGASLELPVGGKWYWRVLPVDEKGLAGKPSKIHSFEESAPVSSSPRS